MKLVKNPGLIQVSPDMPLEALARVVRGHGEVWIRSDDLVVAPADEDSARWITTTLDILGFSTSRGSE